jgi:hypothetical protein
MNASVSTGVGSMGGNWDHVLGAAVTAELDVVVYEI